jgi:hypothetical protein
MGHCPSGHSHGQLFDVRMLISSNSLQACCETLLQSCTAAVFGLCAPGLQGGLDGDLTSCVDSCCLGISCPLFGLGYTLRADADQDRAEGVVECASEECLIAGGLC